MKPDRRSDGIVAGGEEDDRHVVAIGPQLAADFEAVDIREVDVEQEEVEGAVAGLGERFAAGGGGGDGVALEAEGGGDQLPDRVFVFNDEQGLW